MRLRVGRGAGRGALTVFPLWSDEAAPLDYEVDLSAVRISEREDGPVVTSLQATNTGTRPVMLAEGQVFDGGWQHRMLTRSVLLSAGSRADLDVVCVEQGRWGGEREQSVGRRASMRVRNTEAVGAGVVGAAVASAAAIGRGRDGVGPWQDAEARQDEVWHRVGEYDARYGANPTTSFAEHAERARSDARSLVGGLYPLPGQVGLVAGVAGHPVMVELFDNPRTLHHHFDSIVTAAAMDAVGQPVEPTPARRAISFVDRTGAVEPWPVGRAGLGCTVRAASPYAILTALSWRGRLVHVTSTNPRHPLNERESPR